MENLAKEHTRVALVTGASRGIGLAVAGSLHSCGFRIALHYRSDPELASKAQESMPGSQVFRYDLAKQEACKALVDEVKDVMGGVHVLVNNAGVSRDGLLFTSKEEDFSFLMEANLRSVFLLSKYASKLMIKNKWGRIINISSIVGHMGHRGQSLYSASKAAMNAFSQSIAAELGRFGILCNCVAPGYIETQMSQAMPPAMRKELRKTIHLGRVGRPEEVGEVVAFLASEKASYITGTTIHVNGGMYGC